MSFEVSTDDLAKSQLFTLQGMTITRTIVTPDGQGPATRLTTGIIVDKKYKIMDVLGAGGMGAVYRAHHLTLDKDVALKTFKSANIDADAWQRFEREARATASLIHTNIVQAYDFGIDEDRVPYYTMECLTGETLAEKIKREGAPLRLEVVEIFLQVCEGLAAAHAKGIIHRDLTPSNIFLAQIGGTSKFLIKILDFGIAGLAQDSLDQRLTSSGTIFGSPLYMSPEQTLGEEITEKSDIYSCGCSLFESLIGKAPFRGDNALATMLKHQQSPVPSLNALTTGEKFPQRLDRLVSKMLAKNPNDRAQSVQEIVNDLQEIKVSFQRSALKAPSTETRQSIKNQDLYQTPNDSTEGLSGKGFSSLKLFAAVGAVVIIALISSQMIPKRNSHELARHILPSTITSVSASPALSPKEGSDSSDTDLPAAPGGAPMAPYLTGQTPDGWKHFRFPVKFSLGELSWEFPSREFSSREFPQGKSCQATGAVNIEPGSRISLRVTEKLAASPQYYSGLGANDLYGLTLHPNRNWADSQMPYIAKLTGLQLLDISHAKVHAKSLVSLNSLRHLKSLMVRQINLSGEQLAPLEILPALEHFVAGDFNGTNAVLKKFDHSKTMVNLVLNHCDADDASMKTIATMTNLQRLGLTGDDAITGKGFQMLAPLKELRSLEIEHTNVKSDIIPILKALPHLQNLSISAEDWSLKDSARLHQELKHCKIIPGEQDPMANIHKTVGNGETLRPDGSF